MYALLTSIPLLHRDLDDTALSEMQEPVDIPEGQEVQGLKLGSAQLEVRAGIPRTFLRKRLYTVCVSRPNATSGDKRSNLQFENYSTPKHNKDGDFSAIFWSLSCFLRPGSPLFSRILHIADLHLFLRTDACTAQGC